MVNREYNRGMFIAVDIGATKTALASFSTHHPNSLQKTLEFPTLPIYPDELARLTAAISELISGANLDGLGLSLAARLSQSGKILSKSNLPDYYAKNLAQDLSAQFPAPVICENDAVCAAQAELLFGSHPSIHRLLHLIWGTGFGGAFVVKQDSGLTSLPLEPGWMIVQPGGMPHTHTQLKGTIEAYIAGGQIEAQLGKPLESLPDDHRIWQQVINYLGIVIYNLVQILTPDLIIFSGGLIQNRPFLIKDLQQNLETYQSFITIPPVVLTSITPNPCLIGALSLLK